jgi:basic membrane protein A
MFHKKVVLALALFALLALSLSVVTAQDEVNITLVINGTLGDKSFFDSAQRGADRIMDEFPNVTVNTIELGIDPANWETGLRDAMSDEESYDILIVGTFQMIDFLSAMAHNHPDKVFFTFDAAAAYDNPEVCVDGCSNVYSITYKQNEGSFVAGVYAAAMSMQEIEGMNPGVNLGAVGGQDIPVINDFIIGYIQGACLVDATAEVQVQYAVGWNDPARGKEIALSQYAAGADIVFQIAGGTGEGVFEAAAEAGAYAIGVDSDQASIILDTDPDQAARIITSMMKNVDNSLYRGFTLWQDGSLPIGTAEALGIAEGGVGLAYNEIYDEVTPEAVANLVTAVQDAVIAGDIEILSVFNEGTALPTAEDQCSEMPAVEFDVAAAMGGM